MKTAINKTAKSDKVAKGKSKTSTIEETFKSYISHTDKARAEVIKKIFVEDDWYIMPPTASELDFDFDKVDVQKFTELKTIVASFEKMFSEQIRFTIVPVFSRNNYETRLALKASICVSVGEEDEAYDYFSAYRYI